VRIRAHAELVNGTLVIGRAFPDGAPNDLFVDEYRRSADDPAHRNHLRLGWAGGNNRVKPTQPINTPSGVRVRDEGNREYIGDVIFAGMKHEDPLMYFGAMGKDVDRSGDLDPHEWVGMFGLCIFPNADNEVWRESDASGNYVYWKNIEMTRERRATGQYLLYVYHVEANELTVVHSQDGAKETVMHRGDASEWPLFDMFLQPPQR